MRSVTPKRRQRIRAGRHVCPVLLIFGLLGAYVSAATVYKCTNAEGEVGYRDTPCDADASQQEVPLQDSSTPAEAGATDPASSPQPADTSASTESGEQKDCSNWMAPPWTVEVSPPVKADLSGLPTDAQGRPIIASGAGVDIVVAARDKPDPMSVQVTCSSMVADCFHKNGDPKNSMDACFKSAPRCTTARPWEEGKACCPESCWEAYSDLRRRCVDPLSASNRALFTEHCVPGVADMLQGRQPP